MNLKPMLVAAAIAFSTSVLAQTPPSPPAGPGAADRAALKADREALKADHEKMKADREKLKADREKARADRKAARAAKEGAATTAPATK